MRNKKTLLMAIGLILLGVPRAFAAATNIDLVTPTLALLAAHDQTAAREVGAQVSYTPSGTNAYSGQTGVGGSAIFKEMTTALQPQQSSGTGVQQPFLDIQNTPVEWGYNSEYKVSGTTVGNTTQVPQDTHTITFGSLYVNPAYPGYYEFLLDINESGDSPAQWLSMLDLEVFRVAAGNTTITPDLAALKAAAITGAPVWALGDAQVNMDYRVWSGSGQNLDVAVFIPTGAFAGAAATDLIYLYSAFGTDIAQPGKEDPYNNGTTYASNDGMEQWSQRVGVSVVPEPSMLLLLGAGLVGLGAAARRRVKK